jgi:electron transport complex protein RnfG
MAMFDPVRKYFSQHGKTWTVTAGVAASAVVVVYLVMQLTAARIAHNEQAWLEAQINALVPSTSHDNDILADNIALSAPEFLGSNDPVIIYRARRNGLPIAAVMHTISPDGYGGPIELLVAVNYDGEIMGVRILSHHETVGIGNAFESRDSHWLNDFKGHSIHRPDTAGWNVRKDGGEFEQFTSATITPRAIIKAVQRALDFYQRYRDKVFASQ